MAPQGNPPALSACMCRVLTCYCFMQGHTSAPSQLRLSYSGAYAGTYAGTYAGAYAGAYAGTYAGTYTGAYAGAYAGASSKQLKTAHLQLSKATELITATCSSMQSLHRGLEQPLLFDHSCGHSCDHPCCHQPLPQRKKIPPDIFANSASRLTHSRPGITGLKFRLSAHTALEGSCNTLGDACSSSGCEL